MSPRWLHWPAAGGWSPSDLADLRAWYDADDSTTIFDATTGGSLPSSGNDVARWEDKSGGGYHVTQGTAADCPHYVTNTLNGKPVIECTSQWLTAATASDWTFLHNATGSTVVAVWKPGNTVNPDAAYALLGTLGGTASIGIQLQFDDRSSVSRDDQYRSAVFNNAAVIVNFTGNNALSANTPAITADINDPGNATAADRSSIRIDGGASVASNASTGTAATANPTYTMQLGAAGNGVLPLTGYIAEVVICDALLSQSDREKVEGYLAHKWGLTANLPSTHPYKSTAP